MYALLLGIVFIALKYFEVEPVAEWVWWQVLSPLAVAVVWWHWADTTGYTKRKVTEKLEQRKQERVKKSMDNLGLGQRRRR